ncbi:MAG: mannose-6-phosphate isomerase [Streptosporangiales bacterium]|nr:mannose-6-phosphate isomerase [Streptosporangiales bacterium]
MLRQVASSGAQVRTAVRAAAEAGVEALAADGRPRAVVVTGMGGSGIAGDVLAAVAGPGCPVPISTLRSHVLPGWVGAQDLVIAVSCSGTTEETLATAAEAARRGCRMLGVGGPEGPLRDVVAHARAPYVPVDSAGQPRATLWGLSMPLVVAAGHLGLTRVPEEAYEAAAAVLDEIARRCRPDSDAFVNPGKELALALAGRLPLIWGTSPLAGVAAYRFTSQLAENAKYASVSGELPEAGHNQICAFDGVLGAGGGERDIFADPPAVDTVHGLRLVLLRDAEEHPAVARRREATLRLAEDRGVPVTEIPATGDSPLERLAALVGPADYASVYLALAYGIDPTPVAPIEQLKSMTA